MYFSVFLVQQQILLQQLPIVAFIKLFKICIHQIMSCNTKCECIPLQLIRSLSKRRTIPELDLQGCNIEHTHDLKQLKSEVTLLYLSANRIKTLEYLPTSLQYLDVSNNKISDLSPLQDLQQLKHLRCSHNLIQKFEIQPALLELLDISNNYLTGMIPHIITLHSLSITGNSFKNYQQEVVDNWKNLIVLDGQLIRHSSESDYIVKMQEQQLAQKFQVNIDYLSKWRQEVFKQLVANRSLNLLITQHFRNFQKQLLANLGSLKSSPLLDKFTKRLNQLQKSIQHCHIAFRKQKQASQYEQQLLTNSLRNLIEEDTKETKPDVLIKLCSQYVQNLKLQNQQLRFEKEVILQENELLKAQVDHFQQMYNQIKILKNEEQGINQNKGIQQLYQQIRQLEEEKIKISLELANQKELKNLEILQNKAQLEQQVALLKQELEFTKQKLNIQQEETRLRLEQVTQQFEKRWSLQDKDHQDAISKIRQDYQQIIDGFAQKEQGKNSEILKLRDIQNDLEMSFKSTKQEYEHKLKEAQNQMTDLGQTIRQSKQKIGDQEILIEQLTTEYRKQIEEQQIQNERKLLECTQIQNELQQLITQQNFEQKELRLQIEKSEQQIQEMIKVLDMKDCVIRQLTLKQPNFQQSQKQPYKPTDLELRAQQIVDQDEF